MVRRRAGGVGGGAGRRSARLHQEDAKSIVIARDIREQHILNAPKGLLKASEPEPKLRPAKPFSERTKSISQIVKQLPLNCTCESATTSTEGVRHSPCMEHESRGRNPSA